MLLPDIFIFPRPRRLFPAGAALFWREARFISRELIGPHITLKNALQRKATKPQVGGARVLAMGGASSHDREWREEGVSWWSEELPSEEEIEHAWATLAAHGWKVDYVVTHTCANRFLSQTLHPDPNWMNPPGRCPDRLP